MLRIPVYIKKEESGLVAKPQLIETSEILSLKKEAEQSCKEALKEGWPEDPEIKYAIYFKSLSGMKGEIQSVEIWLDGLKIDEETLEELKSNPYTHSLGIIYRREDVKKSEEKEEVSETDRVKEDALFLRAERPVLWVIKDTLNSKYITVDGCTESLDDAEAFDNYKSAEEYLDDIQNTRDLKDFFSEEYLFNVKEEERNFWGEEYEEELKFADKSGIIDTSDLWKQLGLRIVPLYVEKFVESTKAKEKEVEVPFLIPVNEKGRIKATDAKKLLKHLSTLQILKVGTTYFIRDAAGNETCWDFSKSLDSFYDYEFSCEIFDDDRDFYNCLSLSKRAGKLDLVNSEWDAHKVESQKRPETSLRESESSETSLEKKMDSLLQTWLNDLLY